MHPIIPLLPAIKKRLMKESPLRQGEVIQLYPGEVSMVDLPSPVSFIGTSHGNRRNIDIHEQVAKTYCRDVVNSRDEIVNSLVAGMIQAEQEYFYKVLFGSDGVVFVNDEKVEQTQRLFESLNKRATVLPESFKKNITPLYRNAICLMRVDLELIDTGTELVIWELPALIIKHAERHHYSFKVQ